MKKQSFLLVLIVMSFACSKSSGNNPTPAKTKTELISQNSWKFDKVTAGAYGDVSAYVDACYKDNLFVFAANGTGTVSEGTVVCSPSTAGNFTWSFQSGETILYVSATLFPGGSSSFTLVSLTETNLVISQPVTLPPPYNVSVTAEFTLKH